MRKVIITIALMLSLIGSGQKMFADPIEMVGVYIIDPTSDGTGNTKTPIEPLFIDLEENYLTLPVINYGVTLQLLDEDGYVAYSTYVPAGTTVVYLPTTLSGEFEIRLVTGSFYFYGFITL